MLMPPDGSPPRVHGQARAKTMGSETLKRISLSSYLQGWHLTGVVAGFIALGALAVVVWHQGDVEGIRLVIRLTARVSLVLFSLAFTAAALARSLPNVWTRWQRRNRRYLGVSFAISHGVHLIASRWCASIQCSSPR
jgi:hypothetical protein